MSANPAITGIGLMTVLAPTPHDTWTALLAGKSISNHAKIPNINCDNRVNTLAQTVARQALTQSRWTASDLSDDSTALIVATSKGPVESWLANHGPGENGGAAIADVAFSLARSLHMGLGPRLTFSTACASGLHALIRAAELIKHGHARRALVVAAEASVHPLFIQSFNRLGVLAPEGHGCRPFDQTRAGFTMTEAAAAICLEPSKSNSAPALARVDRYALGGDATHLTASDPEAKTLRRLLAQVLNNNPICLIHAHGTATKIHDPIELSALQDSLPQNTPDSNLYSHKAALGHSLGAAGLVSIVLNCLAHRSQTIPPNIRTQNPLPARNLQICASAQHRPIHRSLAIATGFGGATAVVSLTN